MKHAFVKFVSWLLCLQFVHIAVIAPEDVHWTDIWFEDGTGSHTWIDDKNSAIFGSNFFMHVCTSCIEQSGMLNGEESIQTITHISGYSQIRLTFDVSVYPTGGRATCSVQYSYSSHPILLQTFSVAISGGTKVYVNEIFLFPSRNDSDTLSLWLVKSEPSCFWANIRLEGVLETQSPTKIPTIRPSDIPSDAPSITPSDIPSSVPSVIPSNIPSFVPSLIPSNIPSVVPSAVPVTNTETSHAPTFYSLDATKAPSTSTTEPKSGQVQEETLGTETTAILRKTSPNDSGLMRFIEENLIGIIIVSGSVVASVLCLSLWIYRKKRRERLLALQENMDIVRKDNAEMVVNKEKANDVNEPNQNLNVTDDVLVIEEEILDEREGSVSTSEEIINDLNNETEGNLDIAKDEFVIHGDDVTNATIQ